MKPQADSAREALRRSLETPSAGTQVDGDDLSTPPDSFVMLREHQDLGRCNGRCAVCVALTRVWLLDESARRYGGAS